MGSTSHIMGRVSQAWGEDESTFNINEFESEMENEVDEPNNEMDSDKEYDDKNELVDINGQEDKEGVDIVKPHVGMVFESDEYACQFYSNYARAVGFRVRKGGVRKSMKDDSIIGRRLFCSKEGFREERFKKNEAMKKRRVRETRVGCQARIYINKAEDGKWVVSLFEDKHNHALETLNKHHFSSSQRADENQVDSTSGMSKTWLRTDFMVDCLSEDARGIQSVGFEENEARSFLHSNRRKDLKVGDAQTLLNHLSDMQLGNPNFYYAIQLNSDGRVTNFFWADARSRLDYSYFGDVVCFDSRYRINAYFMPFVPIVGVNHHCQTTLFGCALTLDDTKASFVWVLETWINAMKGCHPKVILTDQNSALTEAIACVLPHTHHRLCLWHIFQETKKYLGHLFQQGCDFARDFSYCVRGSDNIEEFELEWEALLAKYNLQENGWMTRLFGKRQLWVPAYSHDIFCADISTTQRSESIRNFFKGFVYKNIVPKDLIRGVNSALIRQREKESKADSHTNQVQRPLVLRMHIEEAAAQIYTVSVFKIFQKELISSLRYICEKIEDDGRMSTYKCWMLESENRQHIIKFSSSDSRVNCSCKKFEFMGILCKHILKVFIVTNVYQIPSQYILRRWTRDAKSETFIWHH